MSVTLQELIDTIGEDPVAVRTALELIKRNQTDLAELSQDELDGALDGLLVRDASAGSDKRIVADKLQAALARFADLLDDYVISGGVPSTSVNLTTNTPATVAYVSGLRVSAALESHTYTASTDTYVDLGKSGAFSYTEVANGAGAPAVPADHVRLAKVVTDADNITGVTDLRKTLADLKAIVDVSGATIGSASGAAQTVQEMADDRVVKAVDLADLKGLDVSELQDGAVSEITTGNRAGNQYAWRTGDKTSEVDGDAQEGLWVESDGTAKTVGAWNLIRNSKQVYLSDFDITADGTADDSSAVIAMNSVLNGAGYTLVLRASEILHVTEQVYFRNFDVIGEPGAEIKVSGADASVYGGGAIRTVNSNWTGAVTVFTSGALALSTGSTLFLQESGDVEGVTVYSQLDEAYVHLAGNVDVKVIGGRTRGFRSRMREDKTIHMNIEYFNAGIAYTDKAILTPIVVPSDSRAAHLFPDQIEITSKIYVNITGNYAWKNGAWVGDEGTGNNRDLKNCILTGSTDNSGYYLDENGVEQDGNGAGTNWTVAGCPDLIAYLNSRRCRGYNVAVTGGSHRAWVWADSVGNGGDPNTAVTGSDDVVMGGRNKAGTVGCSVGEDGDTADNCTITAEFINISQEPVRVSAAKNTRIVGAKFVGEPISAVNGSWSGLGKVFPVVKALREQYGAQDISLVGCQFVGAFTHEVMDIGNGTSGGDGLLRVKSEGNDYSCCMIPRDNTELSSFINATAPGTSQFKKLTTDTSTTGYANVGLITIPDGSTNNISDINTDFADLTAVQDAGETLEEALKHYFVLTYLKYDSAMPTDASRLCRFGITDRTNASDVMLSFFTIFTAYEGILGRPLKNGEFIPLINPLYNFLFSTADKSALTKVNIIMDDATRGYDAVFTQPVVVDIGTYPVNTF